MQPHAESQAVLGRPPTVIVGVMVTLLALALSLLPAGLASAQSSEGELPHSFGMEGACQEGEAPATNFQDIGPPHDDDVECLAWYDLARGRTSTYFGINEDVTRAQAATFIINVLREVNGLELPDREEGAFSDVGGDSNFAVNIETLAAVEPPILAGYDDGTFRPSEPITRDQFASVIDRALAYVAREVPEVASLPPGEVTFPDVGEDSPHYEAISRLADAEVVRGRQDGDYDPRDNVLRGQTASIVARMLGSLVHIGVVDRPGDAPAATIDGLVSKAANENPEESGPPFDTTVEVRGDATRDLETGTDGEYDVTLPPGSYELTVRPDGYVPYLQHVEVEDGDAETIDFRMYQTSSVPEESESTGTTPADVDDQGDFWVIDIFDDETPRNQLTASDADEIRLVRPDGVIMELGSAGTESSWWSKNANGTSDRNSERNLDGDHTLYYAFGETWYELTATFDDEGRLVQVNGLPYPPS